MGNSLGKNFVVTSFGESHGKCIGIVIDGCPAGLAISEKDIQVELDKRKPGREIASTTRAEEDFRHFQRTHYRRSSLFGSLERRY
jgi:chorismate synthase